MRILLLIGILTTTTSWAADLQYGANDYAPPQVDQPYLKTLVKQVKCDQKLWGVVYEYRYGGGHTGITYLGVIDYEYVNSAQVVLHDDTTPGIVECREKIEKHYGLTSKRPRVLDLDAEDSPAAAR